MTLCRYVRTAATIIRCEVCGHVRQWPSDNDRYPLRPCGTGLGDIIHRIIHTTAATVGFHLPDCDSCEERRQFLNRLVPHTRRYERAVYFGHGIGDTVQFTAVAQRLAERGELHVFVPSGRAALFRGHRNVIAMEAAPPREAYQVLWADALVSYLRSPATKAEHSAIHEFGLELPLPPPRVFAPGTQETREWLTTQPRPLLLIHAHGAHSGALKDIDERTLAAIIAIARAGGWHPVLLDYENISQVACERVPQSVLPNAAALADLFIGADAAIAIDSGPGHVAAALELACPTLRVWPSTVLHPLHYAHPSPRQVHFVRPDHRAGIRPPVDVGEAAFRTLYSVVEASGDVCYALPEFVASWLASNCQIPPPPIWLAALHYREGDASIIIEAAKDQYRLASLPDDVRVVVDVGAHIGTFAAAAHHKWPTASIVAIEAEVQHEPLLRNNAPWADIRLTAVHGDRPGRWWCGLEVGMSDSCLSLDQPTTWHKLAQPPAMAHINDVLASLDGCDVLKLDVEGGEFDILASIDARLVRVCIIGEYHQRTGGRKQLEAVARRLGRLETFDEKPHGDGAFHIWFRS